jgi:DNA-directed RNA polymerase specialized sigma24 family protein
MAVRIEGLVSKKVIRAWLDDWDSLQGDGPPKYQACFNSGSKPYDGVSNKQLNKIMLEAALNDLPPVLYVCAKYRWVEQLPLSETLERTGIAKSTYYRRCDKAVEFIYYHVNGIAAGIKDLLEKIREV